MTKMLTVFSHLFGADAIGWSFIGLLMAAVVFIAVQWIKSSGELGVAKSAASVSLNEQGQSLILKLVEEQKAELAWLRKREQERDEAFQSHLKTSETLCDILIAILTAPDEIMRAYEMERAENYLRQIGKWPKGESE